MHFAGAVWGSGMVLDLGAREGSSPFSQVTFDYCRELVCGAITCVRGFLIQQVSSLRGIVEAMWFWNPELQKNFPI